MDWSRSETGTSRWRRTASHCGCRHPSEIVGRVHPDRRSCIQRDLDGAQRHLPILEGAMWRGGGPSWYVGSSDSPESDTVAEVLVVVLRTAAA